MRILVVKEQRSKLGNDGTKKYFINYVTELKSKGIYVVALLSVSDPLCNVCENLGIPFYQIPAVNISLRRPFNTFKRIQFIRKLVSRLVEQQSIDVIDLHHHGLCHLIPRSCSVPVIIHQHGALSEEQITIAKRLPFLRKLIKRIRFNLKIASLIVVASEDAKRTTISQFNYKKDNFFLSPYGTDGNHRYTPFVPKDQPLTIINCGRFVRDKGAYDLVELAKKACEKYPGKFSFQHLGNINMDDPEMLSLYNEGKEFIKFLGNVKDPVYHMKKAWALLHVSHREAGSLVLFEAKSASLPIFAWNVVGVHPFIMDGVNGYLFQQGAISELIESMAKVSNNEAKYNELRNASYTDYERNFKISAHIDRLLSKLKVLIE